MNNKITNFLLLVLVVLNAISLFVFLAQKSGVLTTGYAQLDPTFVNASSTSFTLTTTREILQLPTSGRRVAALIQNTNCTANSPIYLNATSSGNASANTSIAVFASTSEKLLGYPDLPVLQGSMQAMTASGTCTVLVTEWRLRY